MAQYDCALCHLPTPSPLLLLSHLETCHGLRLCSNLGSEGEKEMVEEEEEEEVAERDSGMGSEDSQAGSNERLLPPMEPSARRCDLCQVPFQQRATLESHRRRCSGLKPSLSASSSAVSASSPKLQSLDEQTNPSGPLSVESNQILNVTSSPIPRKLSNLHPKSSQMASKPRSSPAACSTNSAEAKHLGDVERQKCETKNALKFLGLKYLAAGGKVLSSGSSLDPNNLVKLPKAELC